MILISYHDWYMYTCYIIMKTPIATQEMLSSRIVNLTRLDNTWCMYQPKIYWFCLRAAMLWGQNMSKSCHPFATILPPRASWKPEIQLLDPMLVRLHPNHAEHHPIQGWRCAACIYPVREGIHIPPMEQEHHRFASYYVGFKLFVPSFKYPIEQLHHACLQMMLRLLNHNHNHNNNSNNSNNNNNNNDNNNNSQPKSAFNMDPGLDGLRLFRLQCSGRLFSRHGLGFKMRRQYTIGLVMAEWHWHWHWHHHHHHHHHHHLFHPYDHLVLFLLYMQTITKPWYFHMDTRTIWLNKHMKQSNKKMIKKCSSTIR